MGPQELWELFDKILKIRKNIEINFLKNFSIFHKVKIVNININMVISRRVNANASPDVPKPLYQWGGCASPLIQSFGCTDSARALRRTGCAQGSKPLNRAFGPAHTFCLGGGRSYTPPVKDQTALKKC